VYKAGKLLTLAEIRQLDRAALERYCGAAGIPVTRGADDKTLRRHLETWRFGTTSRHEHGRTRCIHCGAPVRVVKTSRFDESGLVRRRVECSGPVRHRYWLDFEPIGAAKDDPRGGRAA